MSEGILSKQDIEAKIDSGELVVNARKDNLEACSYDLRIGTIFKNGQIINENHPDANRQFDIQPGEIINLFTLEEIKLSSKIMATVFARNAESSFKALLVLNPGHIDPGFQGLITIKAINLGKDPLSIQRGQKILTIIFEEMPNVTTSPYNRQMSRAEQEQKFNDVLVQQNTYNLSQIIAQGSDSPYPTKQEVELMIVKHWITVLTLILTAVAALTGIIAVWISMQPKSENNNQNPIPLESPSPTPSPKGTQG
jgi:deoxycytidine triphosphate deaminase